MPRKAPSKGKGDMTTREAGRLGGNKVKEEYGHEFYAEIGHKGGQIGGRKGGNTTKQKYGPQFYSQIGKKGGNKVRELINAGKKSLGQD
ncbi:Glucose starvation-inducible protein B [compost metagenome]